MKTTTFQHHLLGQEESSEKALSPCEKEQSTHLIEEQPSMEAVTLSDGEQPKRLSQEQPCMEAATSSEKAQSTLLGPENPLTRSQDEPDEKVTSSSEMKDQMVIDEEIRTLKRKRKKRTNGERKSASSRAK